MTVTLCGNRTSKLVTLDTTKKAVEMINILYIFKLLDQLLLIHFQKLKVSSQMILYSLESHFGEPLLPVIHFYLLLFVI